MPKYCYFPILKTRPSEFAAYDVLENSVKDGILPILEMTGALGYTYPKNYREENLRGKKRPGDIYKKIRKILDLVEARKFVLDITDDESLMYYGLSDKNNGLLDHTNGYKAWLDFLKEDRNFKQQVIPTIQFHTKYRNDVEEQIKSLDSTFHYIAIKLPAFMSSGKNIFDSNTIVFNSSIQRIINWINGHLTQSKLIVILDFGYIKEFDMYNNLIVNGLSTINDLSGIAALIPVSSSFPHFVTNVSKPIPSAEIDIFDCVKTAFPNVNNIYCGDYSSIHPTQYEGGGGWIPRIDYIVRDDTGRVIQYDYFRGTVKNTSLEYIDLAEKVINAKNYIPITALSVVGDQRIAAKAGKRTEGKAPAYWITVRSNIYMTTQYLYLKAQGSFLSL
jgi:hypothetical protein